jgi:drug/metabolite transporter (DMT)-like permease
MFLVFEAAMAMMAPSPQPIPRPAAALTATASPSAPLSPRSAYWLLALVVLLWGANWPTMKVALDHITPLWFTVARMLTGAACLFAFLAWRRRLAWPTRQDWPVIVSVGICHMGLFQPLVNFGLEQVPAGRSAVLVYTTPLWVVPGAILLFGERLTPLKSAGMAAGLLGVAVLFNPLGVDWGDRGIIFGSLLLMLAAMIWGIGILHIRGHRWHLSPLQLTPWQLLFAGLGVLPPALWQDGFGGFDWGPVLIGALVYNGPIATAFCFWAATSITRALPATTSSLSFLAVPMMGVLLSTIALGEVLDATLIGGFGLILAGVVLVNLADRRARAA